MIRDPGLTLSGAGSCLPRSCAVGLNYPGNNVAESAKRGAGGQARPRNRWLFLKPTSAVILRGGRARSSTRPASTCFKNDVSARNYQRQGRGNGPRAKGFDTFAPLGPWGRGRNWRRTRLDVICRVKRRALASTANNR